MEHAGTSLTVTDRLARRVTPRVSPDEPARGRVAMRVAFHRLLASRHGERPIPAAYRDLAEMPPVTLQPAITLFIRFVARRTSCVG
jgi:hypothetical protein